jgi:hypothetical protein
VEEEMLERNHKNNALKYAKKWAQTQGRFNNEELMPAYHNALSVNHKKNV